MHNLIFFYNLNFTHDINRQEEHQIKQRRLGVVFKDLHVAGLGANTACTPMMGSTFNPLNMIETTQNAQHPPVCDILSGFEGVVKPGEMLHMFSSSSADLFLIICPAQLSLEYLELITPPFSRLCHELSITQSSLVVVLSHPRTCDSGFVNVLIVGQLFFPSLLSTFP